MFCTWLVLKLAQCYDLLGLLRTLRLPNALLCPGMQLGKPDKPTEQYQLRTTASQRIGFVTRRLVICLSSSLELLLVNLPGARTI